MKDYTYLDQCEAEYARDLCDFLDESPVNFLAVEAVRKRLDEHGFRELRLADSWHLAAGDRCYVRANGSAIFAFIVGAGPLGTGFNIIASHSDSPGFRIKPGAVMRGEGGLRLNTEVYGGPILYTWFDRPLSMAGRVVLGGDHPLHPRTIPVMIDRPMLIIPHLAIHFNRSVNEGNPLSKQKDMLPVLSLTPDVDYTTEDPIRSLVAGRLDIEPEDILDYDLSLFPVQKACTAGLFSQMICSARLDDLSMVHASLVALLAAASAQSRNTRVMAVFDNEETGSGTKQGAGSPVLEHIWRRIVYAMGGNDTDFIRSVADSFLISADNAHGFHPNYPEKYDPTNHPVLGGGPCIKVNANCKYMTDAESAAIFAGLCTRAGVKCQYFVNRSDIAGGSTLGNILTGQLPLRGVDMGAPLWAMHSACETGAVSDHCATASVFRTFYTL